MVRVDVGIGPCKTDSVHIVEWVGPKPPTDAKGHWISAQGSEMPIEQPALSFDAGWLKGHDEPVELSIDDVDPGGSGATGSGTSLTFVLRDAGHEAVIQWAAVSCS